MTCRPIDLFLLEKMARKASCVGDFHNVVVAEIARQIKINDV